MITGKIQQNIAFKRLFNEEEKREARTLLKKAKEQLADNGKSILIVHEPCLPQAKETDTGIGHLTSETSLRFFDFAKNYLGINAIEVLPPGEIQLKTKKDFYNTYNGSALSLGTQGINLELLTKPEGKSLLTKEDLDEVVRQNSESQKDGFANYENILGSDSAQEKALEKAFRKFIKSEMYKNEDYKAFKKENKEWLERKAIYQIIKKRNNNKSWRQWDLDIYKNLYTDNNPKKIQLIKQLKKLYAKDIEFYKFKQFLAEQHLQIGRKKLNEKGMKLIGDCLIGFSEDEVWAYRDAFKVDKKGKIVEVGLSEWKIPALNYDEITIKDSAAQNLLKKKVKLFAQRYDGIRFDSAWSYITPKLSDGTKFDFGGQILDLIEDTVKEVKGENYDQSDLIHEFEASPEDFSIFDKDTGNIKPFLRNRTKLINSAYMDEKYGTAYAMRKLGANSDSYIIGVGNHDPQPLRQIADEVPEITDNKKICRKEGQINVLKSIFNISYDKLKNPINFVRYKFAEPLTAKNNMVFYMDVFGRADRFDSQAENSHDNYRQRIPENFEEAYQTGVESGYGYNPLDAYAKALKKTGLDKNHKELYEKLVRLADILYESPLNNITEKKETDTDIEYPIENKGNKKILKTTGGVALGAGLIAAVIALAKKGLNAL